MSDNWKERLTDRKADVGAADRFDSVRRDSRRPNRNSVNHTRESSSDELTFYDIVESLIKLVDIVRSRWIWGFSAALLALLAFGYYYTSKKPEYTAVTTLLAQSTLDEILQTDGSTRGNVNNSEENLLHNHLAVMQSRRFTIELVERLSDEEKERIVAPYMDPMYDPRTATREFIEGRLNRRMGATRQRDREFFTLSFKHQDAEVAVMVVNKMAETYLDIVQKEFKESSASAADLLRKQAENLELEILKLEDEQRLYREKHNIVSTEEGNELLSRRLSRIDEDRFEAKIERMRLESQYNEAANALREDVLPFHNKELSEFANTQTLKEQLDAINADKQVLSLRYGRMHPKMQDIDNKIDSLENNLKRNFELAFRELENRYKSLVEIEQRLETEFKNEFANGLAYEGYVNQLRALGNEIEAKRETLEGLLRRVSDVAVESNLPADVMRVVDPGFLVETKIGTRKIAIVFAFLLTGGSFVGIPLFIQLFDRRLKASTDVEGELGISLLGGVPNMAKVGVSDRPHIVRDKEDPMLVETFLRTVAQIELQSGKAGGKVYAVTSTLSGEGKSTILSNIAAGFSQVGRKTLIIDCDLRRPKQHQINRTNKAGGLIRMG